MSGILEDDRVKWIRQRVVMSLDINPQAFDEHFAETMENFSAAQAAQSDLNTFLSNPNGAGTSLFFASKKWEEEITGAHNCINSKSSGCFMCSIVLLCSSLSSTKQ